MKEKYSEHLGKKIGYFSSLALLFLGFCFSLFAAFNYVESMKSRDQVLITGIINYLEADVFDPDKVEQWIETEEEGKEYENAINTLSFLIEHYGVRAIYIIKPLSAAEENNTLLVLANSVLDEDVKNEGIHLSGTIISKRDAEEKLSWFGQDDEIHYFYSDFDAVSGRSYSGVKTIYSADGRPIAMIGVDISMGVIIRRALLNFILTMVCTELIVVAFQYNLYRWIRKTVIFPLKRLGRSAERFASKSDELKDPKELVFMDPDIHTNDEIERLSDNVQLMSENMRSYVTNLVEITKKEERIDGELEAAAAIQMGMLPKVFPCLPGIENVEIYASSTPAREVGGDFYDYFAIDEDHMGIVIADVSGKGAAAALFMVIAKTLIKSQAVSGHSVSKTLELANNQLLEHDALNMFVTVWFGILDLNTGVITAANAGHEFPAIRKPGGKYELLKDRHGLAVSAMENMRYKEYTIKLVPGESLFLYTDGIPEATNGAEEMYGTNRLIEALNSSDVDVADPKKRIEMVTESVNKFVGDAEQFDDMTMLCVVYKGQKKA